MTYGHMTPLSRISYVSCITIIDTIILTNYTNNAYIFDTYTSQWAICSMHSREEPWRTQCSVGSLWGLRGRHYYPYHTQRHTHRRSRGTIVSKVSMVRTTTPTPATTVHTMSTIGSSSCGGTVCSTLNAAWCTYRPTAAPSGRPQCLQANDTYIHTHTHTHAHTDQPPLRLADHSAYKPISLQGHCADNKFISL
jgi:hypothetical protein